MVTEQHRHLVGVMTSRGKRLTVTRDPLLGGPERRGSPDDRNSLMPLLQHMASDIPSPAAAVGNHGRQVESGYLLVNQDNWTQFSEFEQGTRGRASTRQVDDAVQPLAA